MERTVLLTGAAGGMGFESLKQMAADRSGSLKIRALDLPTENNKDKLRMFLTYKNH